MVNRVRDRKTGRLRPVDPVRSRAAKRAALKRRGKKLSSSTKRKISAGIKKARLTGRTKSGRKALFHKPHP